jgi:hypothetical protein
VTRDLKETMLQAAASRYGSEHYRGILFLHSARRIAPALALVLVIGGAGWLLAPAFGVAGDHPTATGAVIVGGLLLVGLVALAVRRFRSPYRRRRFW